MPPGARYQGRQPSAGRVVRVKGNAILSPQRMLIGKKPPVSLPQPGTQVRPGAPPQRLQPGTIEQLFRSTVRLSDIEANLTGEADDLPHDLRKLADADGLARADVDVRQRRLGIGAIDLPVQPHDVDTGIGHVVHMQELPPRGAGAPDLDRVCPDVCAS